MQRLFHNSLCADATPNESIALVFLHGGIATKRLVEQHLRKHAGKNT